MLLKWKETLKIGYFWQNLGQFSTFFAKIIFEKNKMALKVGETHDVSIPYAQILMFAVYCVNLHIFEEKCVFNTSLRDLHLEYSSFSKTKKFIYFLKSILWTFR